MACVCSNDAYKSNVPRPGQNLTPRTSRARSQRLSCAIWQEHLLPLHRNAIQENMPFVIPFPISIKSDISSKLNPPGELRAGEEMKHGVWVCAGLWV